MIKTIRVKNFVHFYEEQTLSFNKGSYYFIGQNESGKSCMFEAMRRCMSTSKNRGVSSSHRPSEDSIVICDYELLGDGGPMKVSSGVVRIRTEEPTKDGSNDVFVKFVCKRQDNKVFVDLVKKNQGAWVGNEAVTLGSEANNEFVGCLFADIFDSDKLLACVRKVIVSKRKFEEFSKMECKIDYNARTDCEKYLLEQIDTKVVITYPVRSIATVQWTNSRTFHGGGRDAKRRKVKQELRERTEIFYWFYDLPDNEITQEERDKVCFYFKTITNNDNFLFEKQEDKIIAFENKRRDKCLPLEKVPEGFFEAQTCSILLAMEKFKTICLEEAGRGMHPQMIERLRDLVLKRIEDKVIITTSHLPTFMTPWNVAQTFFFRRKREGEEATFNVVNGKDIIQKDEKQTARMFTGHDCSTIFFARRVLLVEGDSDHTFLSTLRLILLDDEELTMKLIDCLCQGLDKEAFLKFMYSLHIITLNGHQNKLKFNKICKTLSLERYFLLDHDAVVQVKNKSAIPNTKPVKSDQQPALERSVSTFLTTFEITDIDETAVLNDVKCLEKEGLFVWRKSPEDYYRTSIIGTVEGALVSLVKEMDDAESSQKFFEENHVPLKWDDSEEMKPKFKLFSSKKLTDDNVANVTRTVLENCLKNDKADFSRLICFLFKNARRTEQDTCM